MNAQREMVYLMTLLGIVFLIFGISLLTNIVQFTQILDLNTQVFIALFAIGVLFVKDGVFNFVEGIQEILSDPKTEKK